VGDHDFTKFGLIPSVSFIIDIPDDFSGSWYNGKVYVGLKDTVFKPSSPFRHMTELYHTISKSGIISKPILFLYSDGGPDHRLTYVSVQLSLICLFLKLDLDYLCACRTAPYHSWRNPVERVMSILNLGLQCVGVAREKMAEEFEKEAAKANTLSELRAIAARTNGFKDAVVGSLSPVKSLLNSIFVRLKLHDDFILTFDSASIDDISDFWTALLAIDSTLKEDSHYTKANFSDYGDAVTFVQHCCEANHYSFDILKCGSSTCYLCKPIRLSEDVFKQLRHLPHPTPGDDGHYLPFSEVFGLTTSEEHRPSFKKKKEVQKKSNHQKNSLPFYGSVQHVKNSQLMVQCDECSMWRLIFAKHKLTKDQRSELQFILHDNVYTCGSKLQDLELRDEFQEVEVRDHACYDVIEKLYYSANYDPICIYCGKDEPFSSPSYYPLCIDCSHGGKSLVPK
jgi:hypothetical protein